MQSTADCHVKNECDKVLAAKKSSSNNFVTSGSQSGTTPGLLRHLTEEAFEDAIDLDPTDESYDSTSNDTNDVDLLYFARVSKHYLHLIKNDSSKTFISRHDMEFPIIIDNGANYHMFQDKVFFTSISPAKGKVILGDGKTSLHIHGVGTVKCLIGANEVIIPNVQYVPDSPESIYSLFLHIKKPGDGIQSSFEKGLFLLLPTFQTQAIIGQDDLYLDASQLQSDPLATSSTNLATGTEKCCNVKKFQDEVLCETEQLDHQLQISTTHYEWYSLWLQISSGYINLSFR
jgi:hypothetical protein